MSNSNLEVNAANVANEMSELNDLTAELSAKHVTKYRLDEISKIKDYLNSEIKERKNIIKKTSKYLLLLIMQTKFLLHYPHRLAL